MLTSAGSCDYKLVCQASRLYPISGWPLVAIQGRCLSGPLVPKLFPRQAFGIARHRHRAAHPHHEDFDDFFLAVD